MANVDLNKFETYLKDSIQIIKHPLRFLKAAFVLALTITIGLWVLIFALGWLHVWGLL